jgi:hypothetical protein
MYIDEIYFNSRLNEVLTDEELEEMSKYSGDRYNYNVVTTTNGEQKMNIEREFANREKNNNFVALQIKNTIDNLYNDTVNKSYDVESYFDAINDEPIINEEDIDVDVVSEEHKNDYHEYTEDLDKDDPDKITEETNRIRDTSKDPPKSPFFFSFTHEF